MQSALEVRVTNLENALLNLSAATMSLVFAIARPPASSDANTIAENIDPTEAVSRAIQYLRTTSELVSGEHAPGPDEP